MWGKHYTVLCKEKQKSNFVEFRQIDATHVFKKSVVLILTDFIDVLKFFQTRVFKNKRAQN